VHSIGVMANIQRVSPYSSPIPLLL